MLRYHGTVLQPTILSDCPLEVVRRVGRHLVDASMEYFRKKPNFCRDETLLNAIVYMQSCSASGEPIPLPVATAASLCRFSITIQWELVAVEYHC